jgi:hypothetical protein
MKLARHPKPTKAVQMPRHLDLASFGTWRDSHAPREKPVVIPPRPATETFGRWAGHPIPRYIPPISEEV